MERKLYTKSEVASFISQGKIMVLSGSEEILKQLPSGKWIGGTTPYFMDKSNGVFSKDLIFVDDFTSKCIDFNIETYTTETIKTIGAKSYDNGFTISILPLGADVYTEFGLNSLTYPEIFKNPVVGYVAGIDLKETTSPTAKVINGHNKEIYSNNAIALHLALNEHQIARTEIFYLDTIQENSPKITFPTTSFSQSSCKIDGKEENLAEYLTSLNYINRPLIANTNGAMINRDIKEVDIIKKEVIFFAPVYEGDVYYLANILTDYQTLFNNQLGTSAHNALYASICVSYYLLGNLEKKKINIEGAFAFGEIAYQLLNKTLVLLEIDDVS